MSDAIVVGAGALGGWTALQLQRVGYSVTLVDAWEPGHLRSSSSGETRVIRHGYGPRDHYVPLVTDALAKWRILEAERGELLFDHRGVLWLVTGEDEFVTLSAESMRRAGQPVVHLTRSDVAERYPVIRADDVEWAIFEPEAGALYAKRGCRVVAEAFVEEGGTLLRAEARPGHIDAGRVAGIELADGDTLNAELVVFACGPWLPKLFPDLLGPHLRVTRQEVMSFGTPAGDRELLELPVWADVDSTLLGDPTFWYGIPGGLGGAFKLGEDTKGPEFEPTFGSRELDPERLDRARRYMEHRFPSMKGAPLVDSRVCQYTMAPDGELIVDRHPEAENLWIVGGGSGHGYKLGPAIGDLVSRAVGGNRMARKELDRFRLQSSDGAEPMQ